MKRRWRPRLATVLVLITLVILLLPLGGIAVLRIYESALVRQTESELIAQGALIASSYRAQFERLASTRPRAARPPPDYGNAISSPPRPDDPENRWRPRYAVLDLATDPVLAAPDDPVPAAAPAHPVARAAGGELTPLLRDAQQITLAGFRITDAEGTIVATTGDDLGLSLAKREEVRRALTGEYVSLLRWRSLERPQPPLDSISRGTRIRVCVGVPIVWQERVIGSVLLLRTPGNIWQALYGKRHALLRGSLALLALVLGIALLTSLTIGRPVRALREQARRAARGERGAVTPLAHPGTREIADLSETVAEMAQTLESRASYIRDFAAQVSHEFKTPLTAMQGAVEMLREHGAEMSPEERERFLGILESDVRRLSQLVRRLLELARADVMSPGADTADVNAVLDAVTARHLGRGLAVTLHRPAAAISVPMAAETLEALVGGLLDNARQHGGEQVQVALAVDVTDEEVSIVVQDDGPGVSAGNAARVFEPFFTTARGQGGTGLGLAIARAMARAHGGDVALLPSVRGARFALRLPRSRA